VADEERMIEGSATLDDDVWALFNLEEDFAEANDLSKTHPDLVRRLEELWWAEAGRNHVLPMGNWVARALPDAVMAMSPPPRPPVGRKVFRPGAGPIADEAVPMLAFGGRIEVNADVPDDGGEGVLCVQGNWTGGWALVVIGGRLAFLVNSLSTPHAIRADGILAAGRHTIAAEYRLSAEGTASVSLWVDSEQVGVGALPPGTVLGGQADGNALRLGHDSGFPVSAEYTPPFAWTGGLYQVVVEGGPMTRSHLEAEIADILHRD
jgi:arylsulfatase